MREFSGPLDELDTAALYKMLGHAWYAHLRIEPGNAYYLPAAAEVGKREYESLVPLLREDFSRPSPFGVATNVARTIKRYATWNMPAALITAIAIKKNLAA